MKLFVIATAIIAAVAGSSATPMPKYGVKVKADKKTDFARFKTYSWSSGWEIFDRNVHRQVVAAIDRELVGLGMTQLEGEPCDVIVQYASLHRADVDLRSKISAVTGTRREYPVGTLVVRLLEPGSRRELFRGRIDMPLETEPARLEAQFNAAIAKIFDKYPGRRGAHGRQ